MADELALLRQEAERLRRALTQVAPAPRPTQLADPGQLARAPRQGTILGDRPGEEQLQRLRAGRAAAGTAQERRVARAALSRAEDAAAGTRKPTYLAALGESPIYSDPGLRPPPVARPTQLGGGPRPGGEEVQRLREEAAAAQTTGERRVLRARQQRAELAAEGARKPTYLAALGESPIYSDPELRAPPQAQRTQLVRPPAYRPTALGAAPGPRPAAQAAPPTPGQDEQLERARAANPGANLYRDAAGNIRMGAAPVAAVATAEAARPPTRLEPVGTGGQAPPVARPTVAAAADKLAKSMMDRAVEEAEQGRRERGHRQAHAREQEDLSKRQKEAADAAKEFRGKVKDAAITFALLSPGLSRFGSLISGTVSGALAGYSAGSLLGPYGAAAGAAAGAGMGFAGDVMRLGASASPQAQATNDQSWELFKTRLATASAADKFLDQSSRSLQAASGGLAGGRGTTRDPLSYLAGLPAPLEMGQRLYRGQNLLDQAGAPEMQAPPVIPGVGGAMGAATSYEGYATSFGLSSLNASPILLEQIREQLQNMNASFDKLVSNTDRLQTFVPAWR